MDGGALMKIVIMPKQDKYTN